MTSTNLLDLLRKPKARPDSREDGEGHGSKGSFPEKKRKFDRGGSSADRSPKKSKTAIPPSDPSLQFANSAVPEPAIAQPEVIEIPATAALPGSASSLEKTHDITAVNIISSSKIEAKVARILEILATFSFKAPIKPSLVLLTAKASVANKMISVAEIAKREIAQSGGKWFQYSVIEPTMVVQDRVPDSVKGTFWAARKGDDAMDVEEDEGGDEEEPAFEVMKTPFEREIEGRAKVRALPTMSLYLSRVRVESLKKTHG